MSDLPAPEVARVLGFVGYGNLAAPVWFIGLEEGLGKMTDADVRANLIARGRFDETMDLAQAHMTLVEDSRPYDIAARDRYTAVWLWMARFVRAIGGADDWRDLNQAKEYVRRHLGRSSGATFLTYAWPVPEQRLRTRRWNDFVRQSGVDVQQLLDNRAARIRALIEQVRPPIVICHGRTAIDKYQSLLPGLCWKEMPANPLVLVAQDAEGLRRYITPFFGVGQMGFAMAETLVRAIRQEATPGTHHSSAGAGLTAETREAQKSTSSHAFDEFRNNTDPSSTVRLLDRLMRMGLTNDAFARLHHKRANNGRETTQGFRSYCVGLRNGFRPGSSNCLVHDRLLHLLKARLAGGTTVDFVTLAERAWNAIPHR